MMRFTGVRLSPLGPLSMMSWQAPALPLLDRAGHRVELVLELGRPARRDRLALRSPRRSPRRAPRARGRPRLGARSPHWPLYSRSASTGGSPASSIALAASSIGYSTRRHSAVQRSVSSRSHAARRSPSRGWPTPPGLSSHSPVGQVAARCRAAACAPHTLPRRRCGEPQRHVRMADRADARAPSASCTRRPASVGEHVLPDRVARAGVVEADLAAVGRRARGP